MCNTLVIDYTDLPAQFLFLATNTAKYIDKSGEVAAVFYQNGVSGDTSIEGYTCDRFESSSRARTAVMVYFIGAGQLGGMFKDCLRTAARREFSQRHLFSASRPS
jgi:hypothetical protein